MPADHPAQRPDAPPGSPAAILARLVGAKPGDRAAGLRLIEPLGLRQPPVVWKAVNPETNELVAIKFGRCAQPSTHSGVAKADVFDHPHALRPCGSGKSGGAPFVATQFIEGQSLRQAMTTAKRCTADYAVSLVQKLAWALGSAHREGWSHGRVRPEHVMITAESEPLLIGLPSVVADADSERGERGLFEGSPYWAPERFAVLSAYGAPTPTVPADDQWALGVIFYELLAGKRPFAGDNLNELSRAVMLSEPAADFLPDVNADLRKIVLKCLEKNPQERFASCSELATTLSTYLSAESEKLVAGELAVRHQAALQRIEKKESREYRNLAIGLIVVSTVIGLYVAFTQVYQMMHRNGARSSHSAPF